MRRISFVIVLFSGFALGSIFGKIRPALAAAEMDGGRIVRVLERIADSVQDIQRNGLKCTRD